jgi:hypothetical protein
MNAEPVKTPDPNWRRYFFWPADYFPIHFPSCRVERSERPLEGDHAAITWRVSSGLPIVTRIDDDEGNILEELLPLEGGGEFREVTQRLDAAALVKSIGLAFSWAFYVPVIDYVKKYPLGVVMVPGADLRGKETIITITDTRASGASS